MATGQYRRQDMLSSDLDVTTVRANLIPTTSYVASTAVDCRGYREVDFFVDVHDAGSIAKITILPESGQALSTSTVEYARYLAETVKDGVAETHDYEVELNDPAPVDGMVYKVTVPVQGRYVRVSVKVDDATASEIGIYAYRRV